MYAVVTTGGKQYRIAQGDTFRVDRLDGLVGDRVTLTQVCLVAKDEELLVDPARLKDAKIVCQVLAQDRDRKVRVFKKRRKKNYARTRGHRQCFTELRVEEITA